MIEYKAENEVETDQKHGIIDKIEELKAAFEAARGLSEHCEFYDRAYALMPQLLEAVELLDWVTRCATADVAGLEDGE